MAIRQQDPKNPSQRTDRSLEVRKESAATAGGLSAERCPTCGSGATRGLFEGLGDRLFGVTDRRFGLRQCEPCGLQFLSPMPRPEELAGLYPKGYWVGPTAGASTQGGLLEAYRRFVLRDHARFVRRVIAGQKQRSTFTRMLDVGCGDGSVLAAIGEPAAVGMDVSVDALRAVRQRGFAAVRGMLTDCPIRPGSVSLLTAFHFLEHVHPAGPVLDAMRNLLAPGGEIVLQVPNARSLQARLLGRHWAGYDVPRHLVDYDDRTLRDVLTKNGFEIVAKNHHCLRDNPTTLSNSLVPSLYPPGRMARGGAHSGGAALLANLTYLGVTMLCTPFAMVEAMLGRGASVMVHARPM